MTATFIWMMVILKIPIFMLFGIVYWAWKKTPVEEISDDDGGSGTSLDPVRPRGRGPHGEPQPPAPQRVRAGTPRETVRRG